MGFDEDYAEIHCAADQVKLSKDKAWSSARDFLFEHCTEYFSPLNLAISSLGIHIAKDFYKYTRQEILDKIGGNHQREALSLLESKLKEAYGLDLPLKKFKSKDKILVGGKTYCRSGRNSSYYILTNFKVDKEVRTNSSGQFISVNGYDIRIPSTGAKIIGLDKIHSIYQLASEERCVDEIAAEVGLDKGCVSTYLTKAGLMERRSTLTHIQALQQDTK